MHTHASGMAHAILLPRQVHVCPWRMTCPWTFDVVSTNVGVYVRCVREFKFNLHLSRFHFLSTQLPHLNRLAFIMLSTVQVELSEKTKLKTEASIQYSLFVSSRLTTSWYSLKLYCICALHMHHTLSNQNWHGFCRGRSCCCLNLEELTQRRNARTHTQTHRHTAYM